METEYERPEDRAAVHALHRMAFGQPNEALLVDDVRKSGNVLLSMVARLGEVVAGHVLYTPVTVTSGNSSSDFTAVALAPVAVLPDYQRQGIGSGLIRKSLDVLKGEGHDLVFVLGHPGYYPRFGFVPTEGYGIRCEYDVPPEAFMLLELCPGAAQGRTGVVCYAPEFNGV